MGFRNVNNNTVSSLIIISILTKRIWLHVYLRSFVKDLVVVDINAG